MECFIEIGSLKFKLNPEKEHCKLTEEQSRPKKLELKIDLDSIKNSHINNDISLIIKESSVEKVKFKGRIEKLWFEEDKIHILAYDYMQDLKKEKINAEFLNFLPQDIIYTIVKWKEFKPNIPQSAFNTEENEYEVIIPINNLDSNEIDFKFNNVYLSNNLDLKTNTTISNSTFKDKFFKKEISLVKINVSAVDFIEAYSKATIKINEFLDYFSFFKNYSLSKINEKIIYWDSDNYKTIPTISSTFYAKRKDNNYTLIFDSNLTKGREHYILTNKNEELIKEFDSSFNNIYANDEKRRIRYALHWLRRSREFGTTKDKLLDYFMSIEFIVANQKCKKLFEKEKLKEIKELVKEKLSDTQVARFDSYIGGLNEPSFKLRLETYIEEKEINLSETQKKVLNDLRNKRNKLEHGKDEIIISVEELKLLDNIIEEMILKSL